MLIASESFVKGIKNIHEHKIISLIPFLIENIQIIIELYNKKINSKKNISLEVSFLYNSFLFRIFFFLIEYFMANKIFLRNKEYIIQIYKILLIINKNKIDYNDLFDNNNIIQITNYSFLNNDMENTETNNNIENSLTEIKIKLKDKKDICIKNGFLAKKDFQELENSIKINLISDQFYDTINLNNDNDYYIYNKVTQINIEFKIINKNKNDFIIKIIPIKNNELLEVCLKNQKDYNIISSIEQCIIYYLLFLFEDIKSQIEKYNNNIIIKNLRKIFQYEVFKFLSIPMDKLKINNCISFSKFNEILNQVLEKLNKNIDNIDKFFH